MQEWTVNGVVWSPSRDACVFTTEQGASISVWEDAEGKHVTVEMKDDGLTAVVNDEEKWWKRFHILKRAFEEAFP